MASQIDDDKNSSQWPLLPDNLLHEITDRLEEPPDYVRFGAVCKEWHSFSIKNYKEKHHLHTNQQLPRLLIPTEHDQQSRGLYSVTKGKVYDELQLHVPHYKRCCGSSYGWLFFVENKSTLELVLLNPFLGESETIKLPPIQFCSEDEVEEMDEYGIKKAILSKDPYVSPDDYEVVALYGGLAKLAHYKSGDQFWSYAKTKKLQVFADVIFHKGLIYAADTWNRIVTITFERDERNIPSTNCSPWYLRLNTISKKLPTARRFCADNAYLVETSKGDLLLVRRHFWYEDELVAQEVADQEEECVEDDNDKNRHNKFKKPNLTKSFKVYRLSLPSAGNKLRMKTLRGETLFLGDNHSICVSASKCPGLRRNSIYYTDDNTGIYPLNVYFGSCDTGVFNVVDGSSGKHFVPNFSTKGMPPPIFVVPRYRYNPARSAI